MTSAMNKLLLAAVTIGAVCLGGFWINVTGERENLRRELTRVEADLAREREHIIAATRNSEALVFRLAEAQATVKISVGQLEAANVEVGQLKGKLAQALHEAEEEKRRADELRNELVAVKQAALPREPETKTLTGDVYTKTRSGSIAKIANARIGLYSEEMWEAQNAVNEAVALAFEAGTKMNSLLDSEAASKMKLRNRIVAWGPALDNKKRLVAAAATDSDGRFSLTFPDTHKRYVLVVFAEREFAQTSEAFFWKKELSSKELPKTISLGPDTLSLAVQGF